ncbi:hypothetical protein [Zoogloea sp.]|uniref:hypothetical protein n=1 Tax=Zoogloea sp. TaxID=49181 RepID=UPI0025ED79F5|nr:hypothetical protein [Zoogloea sp.]
MRPTPAAFPSVFSLELEGLLVDFSKQRIDDTTLRLLVDPGRDGPAGRVAGARLFAGEKINFSEQRAVMHPALRYLKLGAFPSAAWDVMPEVRAVRAQMRRFRSGCGVGCGRGFRARRFATW